MASSANKQTMSQQAVYFYPEGGYFPGQNYQYQYSHYQPHLFSGSTEFQPPHESELVNRRVSATPSDGSFSSVTSNKNVYVRGIESLNEASFAKLCSRFGDVVSTKAIMDHATNRCKGYGFAMYSTLQEAENAIPEIEKLGYTATFAKASATPSLGLDSFNSRLHQLQDSTSTNLYLSNLPLDFTEEDLLKIIAGESHDRPVVSTKILLDSATGQGRGVGFVKFSKRQDATDVISELNGCKLDSWANPLVVRFADSPAQKSLKVHNLALKNYQSNLPAIPAVVYSPPYSAQVPIAYYAVEAGVGYTVSPPLTPKSVE